MMKNRVEEGIFSNDLIRVVTWVPKCLWLGIDFVKVRAYLTKICQGFALARYCIANRLGH